SWPTGLPCDGTQSLPDTSLRDGTERPECMPDPATSSDAKQAVEEIYRRDSRRVYATLVRLLDGDFDLAEESMHEAFAVAVERWERDGVPDNPYAWLVSTGRF